MGDWSFWIAAGGISIAVAASLISVLFRRRGDEPAPGAFDLQVYRAQLAEVDRDLAAGIIVVADADRLRAEISRRILEADRLGRGVAVAITPVARMLVSLLIAVVLAGTVWGYLRLGAPGYPDLPLAARMAASDAFRLARPSQLVAEAEAPKLQTTTPDADLAALLGKLREAVANRPDDVQGLTLLARNEAAIGNLAAAAKAQAALIAVKGAGASAPDHVLLAEILIRLAGGYISPEAEIELIASLKLEPKNGTALYYSGLMFAQGDRADRAFSVWQNLLEGSAPGDPWVAPIRAQIGDIAARAGVKYDAPEPVGPTAEQVAASEAMTPEERLAMIQSMVDGLSARLATKGGPVEDWARLITSLGILGDKDQAKAIYTEALGAFAGRTAELDALKLAATAAGVAQ